MKPRSVIMDISIDEGDASKPSRPTRMNIRVYRRRRVAFLRSEYTGRGGT